MRAWCVRGRCVAGRGGHGSARPLPTNPAGQAGHAADPGPRARPAALPRIWHWLRIWARHDPGFDHWHLGPAAVDRARQGQGVGSQLMAAIRSEEHTSELQSLMRISYAVFCLTKKKKNT